MVIIKNTQPEYKDEEVYVNVSCEYIQNGDCAGPDRDEVQELHLRRIDGGGGYYFVLETKRWAFDDIGEMIKILRDFKKRNEG